MEAGGNKNASGSHNEIWWRPQHLWNTGGDKIYKYFTFLFIYIEFHFMLGIYNSF
jgi:hypothetical protein